MEQAVLKVSFVNKKLITEHFLLLQNSSNFATADVLRLL